RRHDVRAAVLVKRGAMVQITIGQGQRFAISARLVAEQDGRMGQQIKLKNPDTGRVVMGRVVGSNEVVGL
ncbi:MAG: flagella basal body P-ring formation protein FlgA, partial [Burkholderiaceae bacterium]